MSEIEKQVRDFLNGETTTETAPVPADTKVESKYSQADVRAAMGALAKKGISRDEIRAAMKRVTGAERVSEIPDDKLEAMMECLNSMQG